MLELYIGQPTELTNLSYDSILTALSIIFSNGSELSSTVMTYFRQNYSDFSLGNADFTGVSIDTSVTSLPIQNGDTILVSPNMKYAKLTIDENKVNEELGNVVVDNPKTGDSTKISKNRLSSPLVIASVIIANFKLHRRIYLKFNLRIPFTIRSIRFFISSISNTSKTHSIT